MLYKVFPNWGKVNIRQIRPDLADPSVGRLATNICPGGTRENSPAFQRREAPRIGIKSRRDARDAGRAGAGGTQPSLRDFRRFAMKVPALKRRAISMLSLRDRSLLITGFAEWIPADHWSAIV